MPKFHIERHLVGETGLDLEVKNGVAVNLMADGTGNIFAMTAEQVFTEAELVEQAAQQEFLKNLLAGQSYMDEDDSFSFEDEDDD